MAGSGYSFSVRPLIPQMLRAGLSHSGKLRAGGDRTVFVRDFSSGLFIAAEILPSPLAVVQPGRGPHLSPS